jgi:hypothetical protein
MRFRSRRSRTPRSSSATPNTMATGRSLRRWRWRLPGPDGQEDAEGQRADPGEGKQPLAAQFPAQDDGAVTSSRPVTTIQAAIRYSSTSIVLSGHRKAKRPAAIPTTPSKRSQGQQAVHHRIEPVQPHQHPQGDAGPEQRGQPEGDREGAPDGQCPPVPGQVLPACPSASRLGRVSRIGGGFGSGAGAGVEAGYEPTIRAHRPRVGAAGPPAASDDAPAGWPLAGSPPGPQRHLVPGPDRGALAGPARPLWAMGNGLQAICALADRRHLGPHRGQLADPGGRCWGAGLGCPDRLQRHPRSPARRRRS